MTKLSLLSEAPRAEPAVDAGARYPAYPVQQLIRSRAHDFQLAFAREAMELLGDPSHDLVYEPSYKGLRILGPNEPALAGPAEATRARYGSGVEIGPARVRYQWGQVIREPVMSVIVRAPQRFVIVVRNDLLRRGAEAVDTVSHATGFTARAQATQAELLGYAAWLRELTCGGAQVDMWLSHYAPLHEGPGPEVA
jgi:hypothetical protein